MEVYLSPFLWLIFFPLICIIIFIIVFTQLIGKNIKIKKLPIGFSLLQPKGRAIQVEDGISERQPSIDIRRPRDWDSDVVIQVSCPSSFPNILCTSTFNHVFINCILVG